MAGVCYVPVQEHGGGKDTEQESAHKVNSGEEHSPAATCRKSNPRPSDHESGALPTELSQPRKKQEERLKTQSRWWSFLRFAAESVAIAGKNDRASEEPAITQVGQACLMGKDSDRFRIRPDLNDLFTENVARFCLYVQC